MRKKHKKLLASLLSMVLVGNTMLTFSTSATSPEPFQTLKGDLNFDSQVTPLDVLQLKVYLLGISNGGIATEYADLNGDGSVDVIDLCTLKSLLMQRSTGDTEEETPSTGSDTEEETPSTGSDTEEETPSTGSDTEEEAPSTGSDTEEETSSTVNNFISAPISNIDGSLPSQGDSELVIFYIDFPDCTYDTKLTTEEVEELVFGASDESSPNYPFESMTAFYSRSSKGALNLQGNVFTYTAKNPISYYTSDRTTLAEECYEAFKDSVDFSKYDSDNDGQIDATILTVPSSASNDDWWPCAGEFEDYDYTVDGVSVGYLITGNASPDDATYFNSSYLHEMGHCFGLPDYYLYYSDDFDSMNGGAGTELMDGDAYSDFSAFSKLMLGWYREDQVQVYDPTDGEQTFTLNNAQTDDGNCVIIPYGTLDDNYFSEYFIIEYSTDTANNSGINRDMSWWQSCDNGIRIHHIKADKYFDGWWTFLKYENGSDFTNLDDDGIRLIRLVNDGGDCFKTGDTIDSTTSGFGWYDSNEEESIDPNVTISIGEIDGDSYTITITPKS